MASGNFAVGERICFSQSVENIDCDKLVDSRESSKKAITKLGRAKRKAYKGVSKGYFFLTGRYED